MTCPGCGENVDKVVCLLEGEPASEMCETCVSASSELLTWLYEKNGVLLFDSQALTISGKGINWLKTRKASSDG